MRSKCLLMLACFVFVSFFAVDAWAHHPTGVSGTGHAGPIKTISATPIQKGKLPIALQTEFIDLDRFDDDQMRGFAEAGKEVHSVDSISHTTLGIGYGITDDFTVGLRIPYVRLNNIREVHSEEPEEIHDHGDSLGIGDLSLLGQYRFVKVGEYNLETSLLFGLKMPSGRTNEKDDEGERFETEFQPGSGSWDPILGIAVSKRFGQLSLDANALYTFATRGAQDTNLGDTFSYNAAVSYRIRNREVMWDLILEANGEWKEKEKVAGEKDEDSGGNQVLLAPGVRFSWKQWSAYLSVGFPVIQDLNGVQNKVDTRTMVGVTVGF